jgi:hypothetical protein
MAGALDQLLADRAARDVARVTYEAQLASIKADLETRGIGGRIADEVSDQARALFDEAVDVAENHPGVIGGTIAAIGLWILRNPIIAWIEAQLDSLHKH